MTSQSTIETLRESMLNLSKQNTVHYEVTQQAYLLTMAQLMQAEGIATPTLDQSEYVARFTKLQEIDTRIARAQKQLESLYAQEAELEIKIKQLESEASMAKPKKKAQKEIAA